MIKKFFIFFTSAFLVPVFAFAFEYHISTPIPGITGNASYDLGSFVANFFQLGLALVGITSFGFIIYNGIQYVIFSNNESKINDAREGIKQAIFGFLLLISSVVILDTINPCILQTVNFWKSRETINKTCGGSSSSMLPSVSSSNTSPSLKDQLKNKLTGTGTEIQNLAGTSLAITGIVTNSDNASDVTIRKMIINDSGEYSILNFENNGFSKEIENGIYQGDPSIPNFIDINTKKSVIKEKIKDFLISSSKNKFTSSGYYSSYTAKEDTTDPLKFSFAEEINGKTVSSGTPSSCSNLGILSSCCSRIEDNFYICYLKINVFIPAAQVSFDSNTIQFYITSVINDPKILEGAFEYLINNDSSIKNAFNN